MKLEDFIKIYGNVDVNVNDLFDKLGIDKRVDWHPEFGDDYFYIGDDLDVKEDCNEFKAKDYFRRSKRNIYQTKDEAQFALDMYDFCRKRSFEPDWDDIDQPKYVLNLSKCKSVVEIDFYCSTIEFAPFYYPSKKEAQEVIAKYNFDELYEYYGRV